MSQNSCNQLKHLSGWLLAFVLFCGLSLAPGDVSYELQRSFSARTEWRIAEEKLAERSKKDDSRQIPAFVPSDLHFRTLLSHMFSIQAAQRVKASLQHCLTFECPSVFRQIKTVPSSDEAASCIALG